MKLLFVFTYNISLKTWGDQGILERELKLYKDLVENYGFEITLLTYGDKSDELYLKKHSLDKTFKLVPIFSIVNKSKFKIINFFKSVLVTYKIKDLIKAELIKTNQLNGSWVAIILKIIWNAKLIIRTGYSPLIFAKFEKRYSYNFKEKI